MFNFDALKKNLARMLGVPAVNYETPLHELDSLDLVELLYTIEDLFTVQISISEIRECNTFGDLVEKIKVA